MKTRLLTLAILLITASINGQGYRSLLGNSGWCCEQYAGTGAIYREYYVSGSTSIIDKMFGKEYQIQEDTLSRKVWYQNDGELELIYDFSLLLNDTFNVILHDTIIGSYSVSDIDTITILSGNRMRWFLYLRDSLSIEDGILDRNLVWIEGIGSTYGPLYPKTIPLEHEVWSTGTCLEAVYSLDRVQVYQGYCNVIGGYWPDECKFIKSEIEDIKLEPTVVFFNELGELEISSEDNISQIRIYDLGGRQLQIYKNRLAKKKITISNHLPVGIYFCEIYTETNARHCIKAIKCF